MATENAPSGRDIDGSYVTFEIDMHVGHAWRYESTDQGRINVWRCWSASSVHPDGKVERLAEIPIPHVECAAPLGKPYNAVVEILEGVLELLQQDTEAAALLGALPPGIGVILPFPTDE